MEDFETVYRRYVKEVYRYLLKLCRNPDVAEELTQAAFAIAFEKMDTFREGRISVWLFQIAKLEFYAWRRKQAGEAAYPETEIADREALPLQKVIDRETRQELLKVIGGLPVNYKEVFILHALRGMGFKEIGKRVGKSESWGKMTYKRAREMIAERLGGDGDVRL